MDISKFDYHLPEHLIATKPAQMRSQSTLLCTKALHQLDDENDIEQSFEQRPFASIIDEINAGDLLIVNNTKVIPARVYASKETGGKVEIFLERLLGVNQALVQLRVSKALKPESILYIHDKHDNQLDITLKYIAKEQHFHIIETNNIENIASIFEDYGHIPLPPYIERAADDSDLDRYQTVYAQSIGAVAAPTAGLHFDKELIQAIKHKGAQFANVTLHVGAGTFQPVRVDNIVEHKMHKEQYFIDKETIAKIKHTKNNGGRVIAIGTTTVRALESFAAQFDDINELLNTDKDIHDDSEIFIYPGFQFKLVDGLVTNFHLPKSTLIMMVSAFAGYQLIMSAYQYAVAQEMRFYSYGDAMLLWKNETN